MYASSRTLGRGHRYISRRLVQLQTSRIQNYLDSLENIRAHRAAASLRNTDRSGSVLLCLLLVAFFGLILAGFVIAL